MIVDVHERVVPIVDVNARVTPIVDVYGPPPAPQVSYIFTAITPAGAALAGVVGQSGTVIAVARMPAAALAGTQTIPGTVAAQIFLAVAALRATTATGAGIHPSITAAGAHADGAVHQYGTVAATVAPARAALHGGISGTVAVRVSVAGTAISAIQSQRGALAATITSPSANVSGGIVGTFAATAQSATAATAGSVKQAGTVTATVTPASAEATGGAGLMGGIEATLDVAAATLSGTQTITGTLAADVTPVSATLAGGFISATIAATVDVASASIAATMTGPPPTFDAVGAGYTGNTSGGVSWAHDATAGAYVAVYVISDRVEFTTATYAGTAMTQLNASAAMPTNYISGGIYDAYLVCFGIADVPGGSSTVTLNPPAGAYWTVANSVSYLNVETVTSDVVTTTTLGTALSQAVTVPANGLGVDCLAASNINASGPSLTDISGGTLRYNDAATYSCALEISDSASSTTFEATYSGGGGNAPSTPWAGIAVILT